jgi:hypothetical protein
LVPILLVDLVLGIALVATVAVGATRAPLCASSERRRVLGWLLIAVPLPLAVGIQLLAPLPPALGEAAFVAGVAAFAAGALLVLSSDDEDDLRDGADPETPPWWPEFEREFDEYVRRASRPRVLR